MRVMMMMMMMKMMMMTFFKRVSAKVIFHLKKLTPFQLRFPQKLKTANKPTKILTGPR